MALSANTWMSRRLTGSPYHGGCQLPYHAVSRSLVEQAGTSAGVRLEYPRVRPHLEG